MDIRIKALAIILLVFIFQSNVFAVEKEFNEPEGLALLIKDDKWGEPNNGFVTQLIPQSEEYVVGKPMRFGLVLKNISDSVKQYDNQAVSFKPLIIKTADNNEPYDKIGPYSTIVGPPHSIAAGEIVTLFENRDITDEYVIITPGKYTIKFRGGKLPPSNVVEFEVKPGTPNEQDLLISSLVNILPDAKWRATITRRRFAPEGRKEETILIILGRFGSYRGDNITVKLWKTRTPAEAEVDDQRNAPPISEYLGKNDSGYFYIEIPPEALDYWPKMKKDIAKALNLDSQDDGLK